VVLVADNVDTDQIIPARFLKVTDKRGLGDHLFADWRRRADGTPDPAFPLNRPDAVGANILLAGANFGCGSSREHAPQSIAKFGFEAIIAESFAEIFLGNSIALGLPCVSLARGDLDTLVAHTDAHPQGEVAIDLAKKEVRIRSLAGDARFACSMKEGAREALLQGLWDPIGLLVERTDDIRAVAAALPYMHFA
jgi:3-isopropylmalate/(R)-2-methylmalate dehydratase small subunit